MPTLLRDPTTDAVRDRVPPDERRGARPARRRRPPARAGLPAVRRGGGDLGCDRRLARAGGRVRPPPGLGGARRDVVRAVAVLAVRHQPRRRPRARAHRPRPARPAPRRRGVRAGRISFAKARAIVRVADTDTEEVLLQVAEHCTAAQLEKVVAGGAGPTRGRPRTHAPGAGPPSRRRGGRVGRGRHRRRGRGRRSAGGCGRLARRLARRGRPPPAREPLGAALRLAGRGRRQRHPHDPPDRRGRRRNWSRPSSTAPRCSPAATGSPAGHQEGAGRGPVAISRPRRGAGTGHRCPHRGAAGSRTGRGRRRRHRTR